MVKSKFEKHKRTILTEVRVCKEDYEQVTKAKYVVLTRVLSVFNFEHEQNSASALDAQLATWKTRCLRGLETGLCSQAGFFLSEMAALIVLLPSVFKLQLLVEDRSLESTLR